MDTRGLLEDRTRGWESRLRTHLASCEDPLDLVALSVRLLGPASTLACIHSALPSRETERFAHLLAWAEGKGSRDAADAAFEDVPLAERPWIRLAYFCVDFALHGADMLDVYRDLDTPPVPAIRKLIIAAAGVNKSR